MKLNAETLSQVRAGAQTRLAQAGKRLTVLQQRASRASATWADQGKALAAGWTRWVRKLVSKRPKQLYELQTRIMDAVGIASAGRVRRMNRELARLAKRVDSLSSRKA